MIELYNDKEKIPEDKQLITQNSEFFDKSDYDFNAVDRIAMQKIDNAELRSYGSIETSTGTATVADLSVDCKTMINVIHSKREDNIVISLDECSEKTINMIIKYVGECKQWQPLFLSRTADIDSAQEQKPE